MNCRNVLCLNMYSLYFCLIYFLLPPIYSSTICKELNRFWLSPFTEVTYSRICTRGCREGTIATVKCSPSHYFENQDHADGQIFTCRNANWLDKKNAIAKPARCKMGCKVLSRNDMKNATYFKNPPNEEYRNGDDVYWRQGTRIQTVCKNGYTFAFPKWRPIGKDDYTCKGGTLGWKRAIDSTLDRGGDDGRPGVCNPLCNALDPINDYAPGTVCVTKPGNDGIMTVNEKKYVLDGFMYVFKCEPGLNYDKNGPHAARGQQRLVCVGGKEGYRDTDTQVTNAYTEQCIKPGCASFMRNLDENAAVSDVAKKCGSLNAQNIPKGCKVTIKCAENFYFENKDYGNGIKLTCETNGWLDQSGQPYNNRKPPKCQKGCRALDEIDMKNATYENNGPPTNENYIHKNGPTTYWDKVKITTKCKKSYVRVNPIERNEPNSYICKGGEDGWQNLNTGKTAVHPARCDPVCSKIENLPKGTRIKKEPKDVVNFDGVDYIYPMAIYVFECEQGYDYPRKLPYHPNKQQSIYCSGGTSGYKDLATGEFNAKPYPCQMKGANGCDPITSMNAPNSHIEEKDCDLKEGKKPKGCKVIISCKKGYHPEDHVTNKPNKNVKQSLICRAGTNGWEDMKTGKKNAVPAKCKPICEPPKMKNSILIKKPDRVRNTEDGKVILPGAEILVKCKNTHIMPTPKEQEIENVPLVCIGGPDKWRNKITGKKGIDPDQCVGLCEAIGNPSKGTMITTSPDSIYHKGKTVVMAKSQYIFKCDKGFQYPQDSPHGKEGKQILECKGGDDGYYDPTTKQTGEKLDECKRGETPGCVKLDPYSPPPNVKVKTSKGCSHDNGKTIVGCKATLECEDGYYIVNDTDKIKGAQELECVDDGTKSKWKDRNTGREVDLIECEPGCLEMPMPNTELISRSSAPSINNGDKNFYKRGTTMVVKCKEGKSFATGDPDKKNKPREYVCKGGNEDWIDKETKASEKWPGESCLGTCEAIPREEGFHFMQNPAIFSVGDKQFVRERGKYILKCMKGYHYPDGPYKKKGKQTLICSNDGTYEDPTRKTKYVKPEKCIKDVGPGCKDLVQKNNADVEKKCPQDKNENQLSDYKCILIVKCKPGYIPKDNAYQNDGRQKLKCKDGYDWVDQNGKKVNKPLECIEACELPGPKQPDIFVKKNSTKSVTVNNVVYVLPEGKVTVQCKEGYVWTGNEKRKEDIDNEIVCVGGDKKWTNENNKEIDIMDEACTGICPIEKFEIPKNVNLNKNVTFHEKDGEFFAVGNTSYVFKCESGYMYPKSPHKQLKRQKIMCDGKMKKFIDPDSKKIGINIQKCKRPTNANECKEIKQNQKTTRSEIHGCARDGDFYPTGCQIKVYCAPGHYPEDKLYIKPGRQELRCGSGGSGWSDQYNRPIKTPLKCIEGCIPLNSTRKGSVSSNTVIKSENTIYKFPDGTSAKCTSVERKTDATVDFKSISSYTSEFYCKDENRGDQNHSSVIDFDDQCHDSCLAIERLPEGVKFFKVPHIYEHDGKRYAHKSKLYVLKCEDGYAYPPKSFHANRNRQLLMCNPKTHMYDDPEERKRNAKIQRCKKLKGCNEIKQKPNVKFILKNCVLTRNIYAAGCVITVFCSQSIPQYPAKKIYLQSGNQILTCQKDGSGWIDQFGNRIKKPLKCKPGCIPRSTEAPSTSTDLNRWDLTIRMKGKVITCKAGNKEILSSTIEKQPDHKFYCERKGDTHNFKNESLIPDQCENACFAITDIPRTVVIEKKPKRMFDFKGLKRYVVPFDEYYVFICKKEDAYFMTDGKPKKRRLKCMTSGKYMNMDTGEKDVKLVGCKSDKVGGEKESEEDYTEGNTKITRKPGGEKWPSSEA